MRVVESGNNTWHGRNKLFKLMFFNEIRVTIEQMTTGKIEIKIVKDPTGKPTELNNMTLLETESFITLVRSLHNIVLLSAPEQITFKIVKGSAMVVAEGPEAAIEKIEKDFSEIIDGQSADSELIDSWRDIQDLFKKNGFQYEASFERGNKRRDVFSEIKGTKRFRARTEKSQSELSMCFLTGELIEVGGKIPNIHINNASGPITVGCSRNYAILINKFLYNPIRISAWRIRRLSQNDSYELCDFYINEDQFQLFKNIHTNFGLKPPIERLEYLYEVVEDFMKEKEFGYVAKLLRLFENNFYDVSTLKTLLVITSGFQNHESISELRIRIQQILDGKLTISK